MVDRRSFFRTAGAAAIGTGLVPSNRALAAPTDNIKVTKVETFFVRPRWLFVKIHTDAGIIGLGDATLENRTRTLATAVSELARYLVGKDPRNVLQHWAAMYRAASPYRGGPVLTSAMSGVDQALWDIAGKAMGVPVWRLLGGPTREKVRLYWDLMANDPPGRLEEKLKQGFTAFKLAFFDYTPPIAGRPRPPRNTVAHAKMAAESFGGFRKLVGDTFDLGFHIGEAPYRSAMQLIKAVEPFNPMFCEIHGNNYEYDVMAQIASQTPVPIATGEDVYTRWGFRPILMKGCASILQPDCSHAGGITEMIRIAAMAEAFDVEISPHNPLSPINLASAIQVGACITNLLAVETSDRGIGDPRLQGWPESWRGVEILKEPFQIADGHIAISDKPGLGIELDEHALEKHRTDNPADR
jgi:galactonate dehydratase